MSESPVLVCIDFSAASSKVIAEGRFLAQALQTSVVLLHAAAPEPAFIGYDEAGGAYGRDERAGELREEHAALQKAAAELEATGVETLALLVEGPTSQIILEQADKYGCRMIVVGSHGQGALHRFLVGSTVDSLVRRAERTVVIVPVHEDA